MTKKTQPKPRPTHWEVFPTFTFKGKEHERGTEFTFRDYFDINRRARFSERVINERDSGEWITCVEINKLGEVTGGTRSITPDRIRKVWKKRKSQPSPKAKRKMQ